ARLLYLFYGSLFLIAVLVFVLLEFTPAAGLFTSHAEKDLRKQAIAISEQVGVLQDSLRARDAQLAQMKRAISSGEDTVFAVNPSSGEQSAAGWQEDSEDEVNSGIGEESADTPQTSEPPETNGGGNSFPAAGPGDSIAGPMDVTLSKNEIVLAGMFENKPVFPVSYPLDGTPTRGFNPQKGHFGIDIATKRGTPFRAMADGAVVNQSWTMNYGWVLYVQHSSNIITIYKHAESLSKSIGDIVSKGDILGTAGNTGIMSSGPHLHVEIWKNGIPQNPNLYLIKS